jgi:DNA-binding transcriptional ArsR family regulator
VLRAAGLVEAERAGREVRYRLTDPDVMVACGVMRSVLERRLSRLGRIASQSHVDATADFAAAFRRIASAAR